MSGIQDLAKKGRNGDNTLMHVSQDEVAGLNALARETMGRNLTTNPDTGLPEAFLFAPLAAPLLAGGLGLGTGALAVGATAGALGAAEAELRGMDDPLRRGLYSGLTAGAASGIGNALSGAAETGAAAGGAGGTGPSMDAAIQGSGAGGGAATGFSVANQSAAQPSFSGTGPLSVTGQAAPTQAIQPDISTMGSSGGVAGGATLQPVTPSVPQPTTAGSPTLDPQQAFQQSQYAETPQMLEGAQNIFRDEAARGQFMQQAKIPATAGFVGLGGQAQMRAQDEMKDRQQAADAEGAAELKEAQDRIRANYAAVGRPMPTGFGGGPLFKQGGIVGLYDSGNGMAEGGQVPGYFMGGNINKIAEAAKAGDAPGGGGAISKVIRAIQGRDDSKQGANTSESDPDFQRFLGELRRGAGNQEAMQQTGYGMAEGGYLDGGMLPGDGMSDDIPATIDGEQPAALSSNEFVIPADVVSHIGNGSSDAGAKELYAMMDRIREARTGKESQAPQVNMRKMMPK